MDFKSINSLLEMDISEVVECRGATVGAGVVGSDSSLDAALAVVLATADHLSWVPQNLVAHPTLKLIRNLACKLKCVAILCKLLLVKGPTAACHYLWGYK